MDTEMDSVPYFSVGLISSYNLNISPFLEFNCPCYNDYNSFEKNKALIDNRQSYLACLRIADDTVNYDAFGYGCNNGESYDEPNTKRRKLNSNGNVEFKKKIKHKQVPIMLGSKIDIHIRGPQLVKDTIRLWGTFILEGITKLYYSYSTFDSLSMHVRNKDKNLFIQWYFYIDKVNGVGLTYKQGVVDWTYQRQNFSSDPLRNSEHSDIPTESWLSLIKLQMKQTFLTSNIQTQHLRNINNITEADYITFWNKLINSPYNMNDLQHRQIISCVHIIKKFILMCIARNKLTTLREGFEKSRFYSILNKNNAYENKKCNKKQSYGITVHEGRSDKVHHFLPTVARAASEAICNSNIIEYPKDGKPFYCLLNAKDLKVAGVQNILTDYTIFSEETNPSFVYAYLVRNYGHDYNARQRDNPQFKHLILNGCIISCTSIWTLDELKKLKAEFPFITTKYVDEYCMVSTKNCILLKYSEEHNCLFSPGEIQHFGIEFFENDYISITPKCFDFFTLRLTPPAKTTVSINNTRGSCAQYFTDLHRIISQGTLGTTCFSKITPEIKNNIYKSNVLRTGLPDDTPEMQFFHKKYKELKSHFGNIINDEPEAKENKVTSHPLALQRLYNMYKKNASTLMFRNQNINMSKEIYSAYSKLLYGLDIDFEKRCEVPIYDARTKADFNTDSKDLRLYVAFGNFNGACNADGVVMDTKVADLLPTMDYSSCITVDFIFKSNKAVEDTKILLNTINPFDETVCTLVTEHEIKPVNSKHCKLFEVRIGKQNYHMVKFMQPIKKDQLYQIRTIRTSYSIKLIITFLQEVKIHIGNKVNNNYGHKNIVAGIKDLTDFKGVTRDGREVHAQLLYDHVSVFSKDAVGQIAYMLRSPDLAIGENIFLAPIDINIHTLTPITNLKLAPLKVDTYTNTMGFDCQMLSSNRLRKNNGKTVAEESNLYSSLHGAQIKFQNAKILQKLDA